jgi:hypothetical protein
MRNYLRIALIAALVALHVFNGAHAQSAQGGSQPVAVQQGASRLDASVVAGFTIGAVNTNAATTVVVPSGNSLYITGVAIDVYADGTGGTTISNATFTSSGIPGAPSWPVSFAGTANTGIPVARDFPTTPIKSLPGSNVVITPPSAGAHNSYSVRVYGYFAP